LAATSEPAGRAILEGLAGMQNLHPIRSRGFTVIELLVVMALIMLLIALLMPNFWHTRESARITICQTNQRQLTTAWETYCNDNDGKMPHPYDGPGPTNWCATPPSTTATEQQRQDAIRNGVLFAYYNDVGLVHCPSDTSVHQRSYSFNNNLGGPDGWPGRPVSRVSEVFYPSKMFVTLDENDPRGYNMGSWVICTTQEGNPDQWIDWPVTFHYDGDTQVFVDGHTEYWIFEDARTIGITWFNEITPNNPDLRRYQGGYAPGLEK
jgi:type II secretory pathway pseudopilin PulG